MTKEFRAATVAKMLPRAVADGARGMITAIADIAGTPEQIFHALTTREVEQWWKFPGVYHQIDWGSDVSVRGQWKVTVRLEQGGEVKAWGEFCEIAFPNKLVMTRRFDAHPFQGERETTISYHFLPSEYGTLVTVREEGLVGRAEAAFGNAEIWEKVLGWLDGHLGQKSIATD